MIKSTLRLFNAIQIKKKDKSQVINKEVLRYTIENGYLLDPRITRNSTLVKDVNDVIGISGEKANSTFHKSWKTIQESSIDQLVLQQIVHYITTYGFENLGIYDKDTVYIPHEKLEIPEVSMNIPLTVIKGLTKKEILAEIVKLGSSGIALSQITLDDIMIIVRENKYKVKFVSEIKNRELLSLLYEYYKIVPEDPMGFLRYVIVKLTGESLLIKNKCLIDKIKQSDGKVLDKLMKQAPKELGSLFLRYKPLFLAMKSISQNKTVFNRLRKDATRLHKPLGKDILNTVTSDLKHNTFNVQLFKKKLDEANIFRKTRLASALLYRLQSTQSIVYTVRNGKGWVDEFSSSLGYSDISPVLNDVIESIAKSMKDKVDGKVVYIPENIEYAFPTTEKQFTGNIPNGTYVTIPEDMIVGIHWENVLNSRIDLDLSVVSQSGKTGWDAQYRNSDNSVLFSGDMTDAQLPNGATELFYLKKGMKEPMIMLGNFYNHYNDVIVPTKIIVAHEHPENFYRNYMIDINKLVCSALINIERKQNVLGLITKDDLDNIRFYFSNVSIGNSITSSNNEMSKRVREYFIVSTKSKLYLREILKLAGANIISEVSDDMTDYIDLSSENLTKTSFFDLIV